MSTELEICVETAEHHALRMVIAYQFGNSDEASRLWRVWRELLEFLPASYKAKVIDAFFNVYCEIEEGEKHLVVHNGFQERSCKERRRLGEGLAKLPTDRDPHYQDQRPGS